MSASHVQHPYTPTFYRNLSIRKPYCTFALPRQVSRCIYPRRPSSPSLAQLKKKIVAHVFVNVPYTYRSTLLCIIALRHFLASDFGMCGDILLLIYIVYRTLWHRR